MAISCTGIMQTHFPVFDRLVPGVSSVICFVLSSVDESDERRGNGGVVLSG
jgi:hypothetical protein